MVQESILSKKCRDKKALIYRALKTYTKNIYRGRTLAIEGEFLTAYKLFVILLQVIDVCALSAILSLL